MNKTLAIISSVLLFSTGSAFAQSAGNGGESRNNSVSGVNSDSSARETVRHDVTGFSNPYSGPGVSQKQVNRPPNPNVVLKPRVNGAAVVIAKYGPVMISPAAPASLGNGEEYLSAPDARYDLDHEAGPAAHRDTGGFKLFSLEF